MNGSRGLAKGKTSEESDQPMKLSDSPYEYAYKSAKCWSLEEKALSVQSYDQVKKRMTDLARQCLQIRTQERQMRV